jgi:hypothetical protein
MISNQPTKLLWTLAYCMGKIITCGFMLPLQCHLPVLVVKLTLVQKCSSPFYGLCLMHRTRIQTQFRDRHCYTVEIIRSRIRFKYEWASFISSLQCMNTVWTTGFRTPAETKDFSFSLRVISAWLLGKGLKGSRRSLIVRYYRGIHLKELRKITKILSQESRYSVLDLNPDLLNTKQEF